MIILKGKTLYIRGKKYKGEVPDHLSQYIPETMKIKPDIKPPKAKDAKGESEKVKAKDAGKS